MERVQKALADRFRLQILSVLKVRGDKINVAEICQYLPLKQPAVSHHLRKLYDAGLVDYRKEGNDTFYTIKADALLAAQQAIKELVPGGKQGKRSA